MAVANPGTPQSASTSAITALVFGLLGLTCCPLLGPLAWFLGYQEGKAIAEGRSAPAGEGIAKAGFILGIIGTIYIAAMAFWVFFWGGMAILEAMFHH
jgi:hypothetical protein